MPEKQKIFYDSFEVNYADALFCGVFVNPNYRGKRIYNAMQQFAYNMWINNFPDRNVITVVEEKNESSLKNNIRIGLEIKGVNYLFKFFGKNFLSIYFSPDRKIKVWNILFKKRL